MFPIEQTIYPIFTLKIFWNNKSVSQKFFEFNSNFQLKIFSTLFICSFSNLNIMRKGDFCQKFPNCQQQLQFQKNLMDLMKAGVRQEVEDNDVNWEFEMFCAFQTQFLFFEKYKTFLFKEMKSFIYSCSKKKKVLFFFLNLFSMFLFLCETLH